MIERFLRRTAALALIVFAAVLALVVAARLGEWESALANRRSVQPKSVGEIAEGAVAFWGITIVGLIWHRRRMPMWRVWARWAAFPGVFTALFQSLQIFGDHDQRIALAIGAGLVVVCWALGELAVLVATRPVTPALIRSKLEIPFPTRGLKARLCVREDRLVLDSLVSRRKRSRDVVAVPWTAMRSIELVEVEQEMTCQVIIHADGDVGRPRTFDVTPGPALHVIGTARELLIPVTEDIGRTALKVVRARSEGIEVVERRIWSNRRMRKRDLRPANWEYRTDSRPYILLLVGAFLLMPLYILTMMTLSLVTGSPELQKDWGTVGGLDEQEQVIVAGLGLVTVAFLYLAYRFCYKAFLEFMEGQDSLEAFPEPPPLPPKTGTVPGSGKKRKKR
ncbi:hypothetical protein SAMN04488074_109252 [Lentzea albidocapillata subsp. violacea]|uniref:Uncharacterized protein n=1 Tax=Lentzea albidocapillata subsp. violacea TaxID=128104 RepID=A0A1G9I469_9PSEU|nr:hypothetical protein [Lentzea albidocapillata]SDL19684.1 hypothetical protein SAMN04488074_109252 [Lentzea albidocapillata subsp. violacea]